jgi:ribosome-associated toxin RatA of RatAB toxin-antitoxin module
VPSVTVRVATALGADEAYDRVRRFERYPELTKAVQEVDLEPAAADGSVLSRWTVHFRNGLLRWTERDSFVPETRTVVFEQVKGDFSVFTGTWHVMPVDGGSEVTFDSSFDLGIPTLASILDPVAKSALRSNILLILQGLLGDAEELTVPDEDRVRA